MTFKVVIPSAGIGSRIGAYTKHMNKALVTLGKKPAICHVIEKFDKNVEIVIILGYLGKQLEEVLNAFYPERPIEFIYVDKYDGPEAGLGYSLAKAKHLLQVPFIFIPNDTIINDEKIDLNPSEYGNWIGYYTKEDGDGYDTNSYRTVKFSPETSIVTDFQPKGILCNDIYIGLAGVKDFANFWEVMDGNLNSISAGEVIGLSGLSQVKARKYTNWMDCGSMSALYRAKEYHKNRDANILEKEDEAIWFTESSVIKFSSNKKFISDRIKRLEFLPTENFPEIENFGEYFYKYRFVNGRVISSSMTTALTKKLLETCNENLWKDEAENQEPLRINCLSFYKHKTKARLVHYFDRFEQTEEKIKINDCLTPTAQTLLDDFNWDKYIAEKKYTGFHGDLHGENIISDGKNFKFIDWRQNFGENEYRYGDVYYDLGKLYHGFVVNHGIVDQNLFRIKQEGSNLFFDIHRLQSLINSEATFFDWCNRNGYKEEHIRVTTALIFLNICGLHEWPYSKLLYLLGRTMLHENFQPYNKNHDTIIG